MKPGLPALHEYPFAVPLPLNPAAPAWGGKDKRSGVRAVPRLRVMKGRMVAALVDLLLDGLCALAAGDDSPGIPVSNLVELAQAFGAGPLPAPAASPQPAPARAPSRAAAYAASPRAVFILALCLMAHPFLRAQNPVIVDTPNGNLEQLWRNRPDVPAQTSRDIAAIGGERALVSFRARQEQPIQTRGLADAGASTHP